MLSLPVIFFRGTAFSLFLWLWAGATPASAQESTDAPGPEKPETRRITFLPIGDLPPHREEVVDGVRRHLPPPPGAIPPRVLGLVLSPETIVETPLQLGRPGEPITLPARQLSLDLRDTSQAPDAPPWTKLSLPAGEDFLVLLTRGGNPPAWSTPKTLLLPHGPLDFPPGRVLLTNLSGENISIVLGEEKFALASGRSVSRNPGVIERVSLGAARTDATGRISVFHQGELRQNPGERTLVIIYRADGMRPRQPIKLLVMKDKPSASLPQAPAQAP